MRSQNLFIVLFCWFVLTLSGCGGGGGGDNPGNASPVADAGADQTEFISASETRTITLTGTATDSDGTIVSQKWEPADSDVLLSGATTSIAAFTIDATERDYTFTYTVTDDDGAQGSDSVTVTVIVNDTPTADAGADQDASEGDTVTLNGSRSSDSDGTIATYTWTQTDATGITVFLSGATTASPTFTVPDIDTAGLTLTFKLTVIDDDGAQGTDEVSINLNLKPNAVAGTDQTAVEGNVVTINGSGSSDTDGTISAYTWVQTDSTGYTVFLSGATTASPTFTAPSVDTGGAVLTFQLTVTDNDGAEQSDTVTVYVANVLLSDSFANMSNWTTVDESGTASSWAANGQLTQSAYVVSYTSPDVYALGTYQLGTYALLNDISGLNGSSYRFSVDITPKPNDYGDDSEGNDVGIMFGYVDASNYYRVATNTKFGYTRFEKRSGGSFETLAVNAVGYIENQIMNMTAEINGNTIIVWIDGVPVFATIDVNAPSSTTAVALYCQDNAYFDNLVISENTLQPVVAIATPLAYSVTSENAITIETATFNAPVGSRLTVSIDGGTEALLSGSAYSLSNGDHAILVSLKDANGEELNYDLNSMVGTGGDYIVTIGDSITNGVGDANDANNDSNDGRIVARQGYQAPLADALTTTLGIPHIIYNEGVPGDKAQDLANRIDSIMERHPMANKVLMMVGTNDSNSGVSPTQYRGYLNTIAGVVNGADTNLWIAYPLPTYENDSPPTTLNTIRNSVIEDYILQINTIVSLNAKADYGPDFYHSDIFNKDYNSGLTDFADYFSDNLHPNDAGYQIMAADWHDILTQ